MSVGERWKAARQNAGLSARQAAIAVGVHENTIYLLENDKKNDGVTVRLCKQVADAYGVSLSDIFGDRPQQGVPAEIAPLYDLLRPLTAEDRVSFIRNVVSNARFMGSLIVAPPANSDGSTTIRSGNPYNPQSAVADEAREPVVGDEAPSSKENPRAPVRDADAANHKTR